jgi:hypothetical protein
MEPAEQEVGHSATAAVLYSVICQQETVIVIEKNTVRISKYHLHVYC